MTLLSRDVVLGATTPPYEDVPVPELDGTIRVRGMTGGERDAFEASCFQGKGRKRDFNMQNIRSKMVAFCCIDEDGARIFSDADVAQLAGVRADILDRLFGVAQRLSGMRDEDVEELGSPLPATEIPVTGPSVLPLSSG